MTLSTELPSSFTDAQVNSVLAQLEANPALIVALVDNAKAGSDYDVLFLSELESRGIKLGYENRQAGFIHRSEQAQE